MISIRNSADMARALEGPLDAQLRPLLEQRRAQLLEHDDYDLGELVHIIVVRPGDTLLSVEAEAGISIASNLVDRTRLGEPAFVASFEFVERHGSWLEAVMILSDDGFGLALFVPDCVCIDADLLSLIRSQL